MSKASASIISKCTVTPKSIMSKTWKIRKYFVILSGIKKYLPNQLKTMHGFSTKYMKIWLLWELEKCAKYAPP